MCASWTVAGRLAKKLPEEVSVVSTGPTSDLYQEIARKAGTSVHRLRITKGSDGNFIPSSGTLSVYNTRVREQSTIYVKDLGQLPVSHTI